MASVFRIGICNLIKTSTSSKLLPNTSELIVSQRGISGKSLREKIPGPCKPAPWPYKTKRYTFRHYLYDKTTRRFDENSKIIVVEGPLAAGKSKLAKELADELDMFYMPEANLDMWYTNAYGYNLKSLDPSIPESTRSFDVKDFLKNPRHRLVGCFQMMQFIVRYSQYIDALAHVLSTGQGVVLDRCVYSDFVFLEAMFKEGYVSRGVRSVYYDLRKNTLYELLRPHLIIYLDIPVNKVIEKIKKRSYPCEKESAALTPAFLRNMEDAYKQEYLKTMSAYCELLVYDWSEEAETEVIVEDIERIDFTHYDKQDKKMKDWDQDLEEDWAVLRHTYSDKKNELMANTFIARFDVPEFITEGEDARHHTEAYNNAPGMKYTAGYNASMGDTGLLFKTGYTHRHTLPLIERSLD